MGVRCGFWANLWPGSGMYSSHTPQQSPTNASTSQGGFAAQANGWRWPIYELLWISGASLLLLAFFLPETLGSTILLRRAERLRKLTGNEMLKTQTELDATADETILDVAWLNFVRAFQLSAEPAILFANVYIGLLYAIVSLPPSSSPRPSPEPLGLR